MSKYNKIRKIREVEKFVDFLIFAFKKGAGNISPTVKDKRKYKVSLVRSKYQDFIGLGDYHYFVCRVIFMKKIGVYSFFCAQQCIENYLKAYMVFRKSKVKEGHELIKLFKKCRNLANQGSFLKTKRAEIIIKRFDPFYEVPRYPFVRRGTGGGYTMTHPDDVYPLDYFIYRMRKEMPMPSGVWDLLSDGRPYHASMLDKNDELVAYFKLKNINF